MSNAVYARIRKHPLFAKLVARRTRYAVSLSLIVLVLYYGFVLIAAFHPALIGQAVSEGSMLTVGIASGLFMFAFFWILTALYVRRANTEFDAMTEQIVADAREGK